MWATKSLNLWIWRNKGSAAEKYSFVLQQSSHVLRSKNCKKGIKFEIVISFFKLFTVSFDGTHFSNNIDCKNDKYVIGYFNFFSNFFSLSPILLQASVPNHWIKWMWKNISLTSLKKRYQLWQLRQTLDFN
jgi:hypothetical protein